MQAFSPSHMLRALYRDKLYTAINVAGLALAMASCMVLGLYLKGELTYDRHYARHEQIYRVATTFTADGREQRFARAAPLFAPMLAAEYPDIEAYVRFKPPGYWETGSDRLIRHGDDAFYWKDIYVADANLFEVFTHDIVFGDPRTALVDPSSAAVSRTFAERYFGGANPLGETLTLDNGDQRTITLVFEDPPYNTHLKYDVLFSYNSVAPPADARQREIELFAASDFTYVVLREGYDATRFAALASSFFDRHMAARAAEIHVEGWTAWLQPLADVHLYSDVLEDLPTGNRHHLFGLQAAVAFILLIACINHVNLATANGLKRAKEIGTRKILGATRGALALHLLGESTVLALAALLVSIVLVEVVLPFTSIAQWLGRAADFTIAGDLAVLAAAAAFAVAVGVLAGLYPAAHLSRVHSLAALAGGPKVGGSGMRLRELLVLVQFTITSCVIACTLLMASQLRYLADRPLGFAESGRLMITLRGAGVLERLPAIEQELERNERILGVTWSDAMLGNPLPAGFMDVEANDGTMKGILLHHLPVAADFIDVMQMDIVLGRNFSPDVSTDPRTAMIVNETLVRLMGWTEPLGKRMGLRGRTVIGVVSDFNFKSLHTPVEPLVMYPNVTNFANIAPDQRPFKQQFLVLSVAAAGLQDTLGYVRDVLARFDPVHPFEYRFIDDALGEAYAAEQRLARVIGTFAAICIVVACLGLFGLTAFTTARRTKEIGIRKVLGASTAQIVLLLSKRTLVLVLVGSLIASALAYLVMDRWLAQFAYQIELGPVPFVLAAAMALAVAQGTVALQSMKTARAKPVRALRHD